MAASQCRSPRCTAERRGVRRELDSWRHRLMHCVGFESILEGLYGPRLRRDLSLFEDCEPEEVTDWSMDEKCSFCNLHKETVSDHTTVIGSLQSTPPEELSSQGQSDTDKIECQAENYLNALFRKKDLPQNCDPNIPLVAQELMKKMIRQFAIEYISKSSKMQENGNGSSYETSLIHKGIQMNQTENLLQEEQDSPLDLTVNRTQEQNTQPGDGVLDLSTKKISLEQSTYDGPCSENSMSGSSTTAGANSKETAKLERGKSALNKVLESLCPYHGHQILAMLQFLIQEQSIYSFCHCQRPRIIHGATSEDGLHAPACSCDSCMLTKWCCLQNQRPNTFLPPLPACVNNWDYLSRWSVAVDYLNSVGNKGISMPCNVPKCCSKQLQQGSIYPARPALCTHLCSAKQKTTNARRSRSPSPPPLSPVETDEYDSLDESVASCLALGNQIELSANQPPSHLPAERGCSVRGHKDKICIAEVSDNSEETLLCVNRENHLINSDKLDKVENAATFKDLMEQINDKLKSIETANIATPVKLSKSDGKTKTDITLSKFIASLLHNPKANDYSFMELLSQHDTKVKNKIIQTRFRKWQDTLFAMHNSPDSTWFSRQALQIKRELASLDETCIRKKAGSARNTKKPLKNKHSPSSTDNHSVLKYTALQTHENKDHLCSPIKSNSMSVCQEESPGLPHHNLKTKAGFVALSENNSTTSQTNLVKINGNCQVEVHTDQVPVKGEDRGVLDGAKHSSIIPPVWCSVYVSNNFLFSKPSKVKKPDSAEREKMFKDVQVKTYSSEDINKIVQKTNLHVVVERLEDTISMAQKANNQLFNGYTISCKMKESHKLDAGNSKLPLLPQTHTAPCSKDSVSIREKEITEEGCKNVLGSPACDSAALTSGNEVLQTSSDAGNSLPLPKYTSPIKLMFLSEINSSEGVKYALTSAHDSAKLNIDLYSVQSQKSTLPEKQSEVLELAKTISTEECAYGGGEDHKKEASSALPTIMADAASANENKPGEGTVDSGSCLKRKPGRPKKMGPQVVKQVKRPIGRPPKPKTDVAEHAGNLRDSITAGKIANSNIQSLEEDNINKNITVTVVFGRSRRTKRCVSEGSLNGIGMVPGPPSICTYEPAQVKQNLPTRNSLPKPKPMQNPLAENKTCAASYEYVRPLESIPVLPSHCSNIVRPNQKPLNVIRKPGRPAKVKISGISVTFNQISSQERKVSISSCLPPLDQETLLEKSILTEEDHQPCNKSEVRKSFPNDTSEDSLHNETAVASKTPEVPSRQSLRERRPSIPFLHSLASSSSLSYRSAFLHKSYKFCLKSAKDQKTKDSSSVSVPPMDTSVTESSGKANKGSENNNSRSFSETSSDTIVSSNPSLRWWDPSVSNDSLLKELNSRYEHITNTWLHVNGEDFEKCLYKEGCNVEQDCSIKLSNSLDSCVFQLEKSPIKMLFQKKCNVGELCTWFMQTTETQSLSLVRKENARNPFEVISTRQVKMGTSQSDCNSNSLRKHFKKFALSTPSKSAEKLQILHKIVRSHVLNRKCNFTLAKLRRTELENLQHDQWREVEKMYNAGKSNWKSKKKNMRFFCQSQCLANANRKMNGQTGMFLGNGAVENQSPAILVGSQRIMPSTETEIKDTFSQPQMQLSDHSSQPDFINSSKPSPRLTQCDQQYPSKAQALGELGERAWNSTDFKDCRIFLKKISPVEDQRSFHKNPVVRPPESIDCSISPIYFQGKRHCSLRSHSSRQNVSGRCENSAKTSQGAQHPSLAKGLHMEQGGRKATKRVAFDDAPTEVSTKMNKKRRMQCQPTNTDIKKRNKTRLCSPGQVSSCYSKYQLGPLKPVGLPLLSGFASRAVKYSMIPFQLPLHGSSQTHQVSS